MIDIIENQELEQKEFLINQSSNRKSGFESNMQDNFDRVGFSVCDL